MLIFKNLTSKRQVLEIRCLTVCIPRRYAVLNLQNFLKYAMGTRTKHFEIMCMTIKTDALNLSVNIIQSIPLLHLLTNLMHQSLDKSSCTVSIYTVFFLDPKSVQLKASLYCWRKNCETNSSWLLRWLCTENLLIRP